MILLALHIADEDCVQPDLRTSPARENGAGETRASEGPRSCWGPLPALLTYPERDELLGLLITQLGPNYQRPLHQKASHGQGKVAAIHFDR